MTTIDDPITLFNQWYAQELEQTKVEIPTAVCLSTIGLDNFPNARFVSLKEVLNDTFIITGPLNSRKGYEFENNNKVALTFWWTATGRQVRIQGSATRIDEALAVSYFEARSTQSKAVSLVCNQGKDVENLEHLKSEVEQKAAENQPMPKPKHWSGLAINPIRIEFMNFETSRFHDRKLYEYIDDKWVKRQIQP